MPRWFSRQDGEAILPPTPTVVAPRAPSRYDLDAPLLYFSETDPWKMKDACEGTQIFGATGSGKTSGSGQAIAKAFLEAGCGGLVLTAKDDRALWETYCRDTGRSDDLKIFSPSQPWRFNFLEYESTRPGAGAGLTENLVALFCHVMEVSERSQGQASNQDYWRHTLKQLLRNAIDGLAMAKGAVSLPDIYAVITSAPTSPEQVRSEAWQKESACFRCIYEAEERTRGTRRWDDHILTATYWLNEFPALAPRTRSIIVSSFTSLADGFLRGMLRELFCSTTNLTPEMTHDGAVIVLDLPIKEYHELGQYAQVLFKYLWQRATERRNVRERPRPVFLWIDESQYFVNSYDLLFQTTARSSRCCTVYLTQNISNYYALFGGEKAKAETDALLGSLQTKIFHANGDSVTNLWGAELFGKSWQFRMNASTSTGHNGSQLGESHSQSTGGGSQILEYDILPRTFTTLRKGGLDNQRCVDALVFQGGRRWQATGDNYVKVVFQQDDDGG